MSSIKISGDTSGSVSLVAPVTGPNTTFNAGDLVVGSALSASNGAALVGTIQSGTGAVARTVDAKLKETVSVKDFGAVGDGVTDDTAAIQAAIDSGKPYSTSTKNGKTIYFPAGTYKVSTLDMTDCHGVHLMGSGIYSSTITTSSTNQVIKAIGTSSTPLNKASISNLTIIGGGNTNINAHGIDLQWTNFCKINDMVFFSCRNALNIYHNWQTALNDISIHGGGADRSYIGLYMGETDVSYVDNAVVANNIYVQSSTGYGFRLINAQGSKFSNCEAGGTPMVNAWYIGDPTTGTFESKWIHFNNCLGDSTSGVSWYFKKGAASSLGQMQLSNCWSGNGTYGWYIDGASVIAMANCLSIGHSYAGITLNNSQYISVTGCNLYGNNEASDVTVGDITFSNSSYCQLSASISNTNVAGISFLESGTSNSNHIVGNSFLQGGTIIGATTVVDKNQGLKSSNRGSAIVLAANTSVVVNHGVLITPTADNIRITPRDNMGSSTKFWVNTVTSTSFTINVNIAPGSDITFGWAVDLIRV